MSTTICRNCRWQISASSAFCQNCGCPSGASTKKISNSTAGLIALGLVIVACVWCKSPPSSRYSTSSTTSSSSSSSSTPSVSSTPYPDTNSNQVASPPLKPTQPSKEDLVAEREGKQAYKIGYKQGCIRDGLEVKNTAQVDILADTAADLVHRPKYKFLWANRWAGGFIDAYNKCHRDAPILTLWGEVASSTNR